MRRSSIIAAVSLAATAAASPATAAGPGIDNESEVFLQTSLLGGGAVAPIEVRSIKWDPPEAPQHT